MKRPLRLGILLSVLSLFCVHALAESSNLDLAEKSSLTTSVFARSVNQYQYELELLPHPNGYQLHWSGSNSEDVVYFYAERSVNGGRFELIGGLQPSYSAFKNEYFLADKLPTFGEVEYLEYRIEVVDVNGRSFFTKAMRVYPHPKRNLSLDITPYGIELKAISPTFEPRLLNLQIFSPQGTRLQELSLHGTPHRLSLDHSLITLPPGMYIFILSDRREVWAGKARLH